MTMVGADVIASSSVRCAASGNFSGKLWEKLNSQTTRKTHTNKKKEKNRKRKHQTQGGHNKQMAQYVSVAWSSCAVNVNFEGQCFRDVNS